MGEIASQITSLTIVYSTVCSGADQRKHQSSASLAFVGNPPVTDEFPAQMASNAKNVSIWWRHHVPTNFDNDVKIVSDIGARARYIQFSKMTKKLYFNWCNIGVKHQLALYIRTPKMSQFQQYSIYRCESWLWAECIWSYGLAIEFKFLAWSSIAESVCRRAFCLLEIRSQRPWVRILHSTEEDNLSPFD